jgi:rhamnulokinase
VPEALRYAAVDLGATSGRVVTGRLGGGRVELREEHRFPNRPVQLPDGLHWNLLHLFTEVLEGLRAAGRVDGVGVDTWGVDYALLDGRCRVLGLPFHYRDERTNGMVERAFERVPVAELYGVTGIQTLPINTVFQLLAEEGSPALAAAERIALVPDLLAYWLSGELGNEVTNASTTGLLDARSGRWADGVIERLGLPGRPFGDLVEPGTALGPIASVHDLGAATVYAVASHDTASAFAAAPIADEHAAILSSGTWSLLGLELPEPVLSEGARTANLTNERGIDGTTRLLKNVMGMWLLEECRRAWGSQGSAASYEELQRLAEAVHGDVPLFDPDDEAFLAPGDMPARIRTAWERSGQPAPQDPGTIVRSILVSLACKYRWTLDHLEASSGRDVRRIHVIGGGARNALLCSLTADVTGREVLAGPIEATALGNVLVQARGAGELGSLGELRGVAAASARPTAYEPAGDHEALYRRFLDLTGLATPAAA